MQKTMKVIILISFIITLGLSFFAGTYIKEQEYIESREQRCQRLIIFAIDKAENNNLSETGVMEALISDIYAAHEFCDHVELSAELSDLWNTLTFRGDEYIGKEDIVVTHLRSILERMQAAE